MRGKQVEIHLAGVSNGLLKDALEMCLEHIVSPLPRSPLLRKKAWTGLQRRKQISAEVRRSVSNGGDDEQRSCSAGFMSLLSIRAGGMGVTGGLFEQS